MKKEKLLLFKVHGKTVEQIGGEATLNDVDEIKSSLAFIHAVPFEDVEVVPQDIVERELSTTCAISNEMVGMEAGQLIFKANRPTALWRIVKGIRPAMDTNHSELFEEFLDLIQKKDFDGAIIFN